MSVRLATPIGEKTRGLKHYLAQIATRGVVHMVLIRFCLARHSRPAARFRADARPEFVRLLLRRRPVQRRFEPRRDGRRFAQLGGEGLRPFFEGLDPLREDDQVAGEGERLHVDLGLVELVGPPAGFRLAALAAGQAGQLGSGRSVLARILSRSAFVGSLCGRTVGIGLTTSALCSHLADPKQ